MSLTEPSERNFALFCEVEFENLSLRRAAEKYQISPTRVQQIVKQTRAWYVAETPEWVREVDPKLQPVVACRLHDARLAHQASEAMSSWHDSKGEHSTQRTASEHALLSGKTITTKKPSFGETRYLSAASQLSKQRVDAAVRLAEVIERYQESQPSTAEAPVTPYALQDSIEAEPTTEPIDDHDVTLGEPIVSGGEFIDEITFPLISKDSATPVRETRQMRRLRERELQRKLRKAK